MSDVTDLLPALLTDAPPELNWRDQSDWLRQSVEQDKILDVYIKVALAHEMLDEEQDEELIDRVLDDLDVLWYALVDPEVSTIELHAYRIRDRWEKLFPATSGLLDPVLAAYTEPHRHYHGIEHIGWGLMMMEHFWGRPPSKDLFLAWVMHDVVYDPQGPANEAKSAEWAYKLASELGVYPMPIRKAILATVHKRPANPNNELEARLFDIDLLRIGLAWPAFQRDTENIRREYSWLPDSVFWPNRARILSGFAARESVFVTQEVRRSEWETRAQDNLQRAVQEARAWPPG